uniref:Uncharacterized protein n=1 Tax=Kalanchoe fedtschenkoi TaxID=63787 RepID=A0A7N0UC62_KALFE
MLDYVPDSIFLCYRTGGVCLDVIKQSWSPMFGTIRMS